MTARAAAPLRIGPLTVPAPVVLAPMAGITNAPFRRLCRGFGDGGLFVSEMITARGVAERNEKTLRLARFAPDEPVRSIQLYGTEPGAVGAAVRFLVAEEAADHVDLNFGCPVAKVTRKGGGAALPVRRALFRSIVAAAVAAAGPVPVTVKLRIGVDDDLTTFLDAGCIAEAEGAAAVALHARTAAQHYSGQADWSAIARLRDAVRTVPVLGNGDIWQGADAVRMMAETGCDGVVVGRGCLGRPWLFRDLALAMAGKPVPPPPRLGEVTAVLRRHARLLADWVTEPVAVRDVRKHVGWYLHGYPVGGEVRRRLTATRSIPALEAELDRLDPDLAILPGSDAGPRGRTSGPVRVSLPDGWLDAPDDPTPLVADDLEAVSGG
ncbi:MAG TPA: tRNA dihydrouridine synthase DusB [Acidimicrobiales bacterium]|nr:tRNA dihydrouridine synthase DusB [Acidimicrobiales bacterium]